MAKDYYNNYTNYLVEDDLLLGTGSGSVADIRDKLVWHFDSDPDNIDTCPYIKSNTFIFKYMDNEDLTLICDSGGQLAFNFSNAPNRRYKLRFITDMMDQEFAIPKGTFFNGELLTQDMFILLEAGKTGTIDFTVSDSSGSKHIYAESGIVFQLSDGSGGTGTKRVATPKAQPGGGSYTGNQSVVLTCSTPNAIIYYTTDGTDPNTTSTPYTVPIDVTTVTTIKAFAVLNGMTDSRIMTADYVIAIPPVATPVASPVAGTYSGSQNIALTCSTNGATIHYTTDGSTPTTASPIYTSPISITSSTVIKAFAVMTGMPDSQVMTAGYTITLPKVATPTASPAAGTYTSAQNIALSCSTSGAVIHYTTDGSTPTTASPVYATPISLTASQTIKAFAIASGFTDSDVLTAAYVINMPVQKVATPTPSPGAGNIVTGSSVTLTCSTAGATIYYTTDGSTPTIASQQYTGPITITIATGTVTSSTTIKAFAVLSGMTDSDILTADYQATASPVHNRCEFTQWMTSWAKYFPPWPTYTGAPPQQPPAGWPWDKEARAYLYENAQDYNTPCPTGPASNSLAVRVEVDNATVEPPILRNLTNQNINPAMSYVYPLVASGTVKADDPTVIDFNGDPVGYIDWDSGSPPPDGEYTLLIKSDRFPRAYSTEPDTSIGRGRRYFATTLRVPIVNGTFQIPNNSGSGPIYIDGRLDWGNQQHIYPATDVAGTLSVGGDLW